MSNQGREIERVATGVVVGSTEIAIPANYCPNGLSYARFKDPLWRDL